MQGVNERRVKLKERFPAGKDDKRFAVSDAGPKARNGPGQFRRGLEATASIAIRADKIRIAKPANRRLAIFFAPRPQVAAGEPAKNRRPTGLRSFALQRVEQ
jgi:hypothetical protein